MSLRCPIDHNSDQLSIAEFKPAPGFMIPKQEPLDEYNIEIYNG